MGIVMQKHNRIQDMFDAGTEKQPHEWESFLFQETSDPEIRSETLALLRHYKKSSDFLERPAFETYSALARSACDTLGEFQIKRELGRGSMGVVYLAQDSTLERQVALKVLAAHLVGSPTAVKRFRHEARAAASLNHPAIVPIYRFGENDGEQFIVMEYVAGHTLAEQMLALRGFQATTGSEKLFDDGASTDFESDTNHVRQCAELVSRIGDALDYAHDQDVLHRDVKPSNILIDSDGRPRLTDFGVARLASQEALTQTGDVAGTLCYMSPEQASAGVLDRRSDVFSLGVVLYEMLAGQKPFKGNSIQEVVNALASEEFIPLRSTNRFISRDLETICHKAIEKNPDDRYPTARHFAADLKCFLRGESILARPPSPVKRTIRWMHRRRVGAMIALCLALSGIATAGVAVGVHEYRQKQVDFSCYVADGIEQVKVGRRAWDADTNQYGPMEYMGTTPIENRYIEPGKYRFFMVGTDHLGAEVDEFLLARVFTLTAVVTDEAFREHDDLGSSGVESHDARKDVRHAVRLTDWSKSPADMAMFEEGEYFVALPIYLRQTDSDKMETARLEGFYLDRTEISNSEYAEFLAATGRPKPKFWKQAGYDGLDAPLRPAIGMTNGDAHCFARWHGLRLPTSQEWEGAARTPDGRLYPWGMLDDAPEESAPSYDALVAAQNNDTQIQFRAYLNHTSDVDARTEDKTENGVLRLWGNVGELTSTNGIGGASDRIIIRGGSWATHPVSYDLGRRNVMPIEYGSVLIGFRCARSLEMIRLQPEE